MSPRAEKLSIAAGALGAVIILAALWLAFPPYVALGALGVLVLLCGVGAEPALDALRYGVMGVEDKRRQQEESDDLDVLG